MMTHTSDINLKWLLSLTFVYNLANSIGKPGELRDYCEAETFEASCKGNEVVMMKSAHYGRMTIGRCVHKDYGYVGCKADVGTHMDNACSGRRSCEIRIPDSELDKIKPCPEDFKTYLEAEYTCVNVHNPPCRPCRNYTDVIPTSRIGYIASIFAEESGCGKRNCPYLLKARVGQRLNLTLFDFGISQVDQICFKYAEIYETIKSDGKELVKETHVCRRNNRVSHIYDSQSNEIKILVNGFGSSRMKGQYMIRYEVLGCGDYTSPPNTWIKREGESTLIGCVSTGEQWKLTCIDSHWDGEVGACPIGLPRSASSLSSSSMFSIPTGILVAVILAIAMVIGVCILTAGLVVIKRRRSSNMNNTVDQTNSYYPKGGYTDSHGNPITVSNYPRSLGKMNSAYPEVFRNEYMPKGVAERPLPSVPNNSDRFEPADDLTNIYAPPYHPYEISPGAYGSQSRHYFELDPNSNHNNVVIAYGYNSAAQVPNFSEGNCDDFNNFTMVPTSTSCDNEYTETGNFSWP